MKSQWNGRKGILTGGGLVNDRRTKTGEAGVCAGKKNPNRLENERKYWRPTKPEQQSVLVKLVDLKAQVGNKVRRKKQRCSGSNVSTMEKDGQAWEDEKNRQAKGKPKSTLSWQDECLSREEAIGNKLMVDVRTCNKCLGKRIKEDLLPFKRSQNTAMKQQNIGCGNKRRERGGEKLIGW